jgi:ribokinase
VSAGVVAVLGGINMDLVVPVPALPGAGETVLGGSLERHHGGKGANQAVAAARAGATVRMIGAVGRDADGDDLLSGLSAEGVDTAAVARVDAASGTALICVAPGGANQIVVSAGANTLVGHLNADAAIRGCDILLASLEVPMTTVVAFGSAAARHGVRVVVNAAPAQPIPAQLAATRPILVVNEAELASLGGSSDVDDAVLNLQAAGIGPVVVTLGSQGVRLVDGSESLDLPAHASVAPIDTTGAGDTFCGVLAAWLANGSSMREAVAAANLAAGLSVGARGARAGMPQRAAILSELRPGPGTPAPAG